MTDDTFGQGEFGEGTFGADLSSLLNFRETKRQGNLVYFTYDALVGAEGYYFLRNGKRVSRTLDPVPMERRLYAEPGDTIGIEAFKLAVFAQDQIGV